MARLDIQAREVKWYRENGLYQGRISADNTGWPFVGPHSALDAATRCTGLGNRVEQRKGERRKPKESKC